MTENGAGRDYVHRMEVGPPLNYAKLRGHFIYPPATRELCRLTGQVALIWSEFETYFNGMLRLMLKASQTDLKQWWTLWSFDSRSEHFKKQVELCFRSSHPAIADFLKKCAVGWEPYQLARNTLLHGNTQMQSVATRTGDNVTTTTTLLAQGLKDGKVIEFTFREADLEDLYYNIGHLGGTLREILHHEAAVDGLSSQDRANLVAFRDQWAPDLKLIPMDNNPATLTFTPTSGG